MFCLDLRKGNCKDRAGLFLSHPSMQRISKSHGVLYASDMIRDEDLRQLNLTLASFAQPRAARFQPALPKKTS